MLILGLLGMYFDAVVVEVKTFSLLFRLALAILWLGAQSIFCTYYSGCGGIVQEPKWVRQKIETKQPIVFLGTTINPCMLSYFIWLPGLQQYKNSLLKMEGTFFLFLQYLHSKKNQQESIGTYQHGIFGDVAMAINILAISMHVVQLIVCHDTLNYRIPSLFSNMLMFCISVFFR